MPRTTILDIKIISLWSEWIKHLSWHAQREDNFKAFIGSWCQSRPQGDWYRRLQLEF